MKFRVFLEVDMHTDKQRNLAKSIVAGTEGGVCLVDLMRGSNDNQVHFFHEGADLVKLEEKIRKRVGHTTVVSVTPLGYEKPPLMPPPMVYPTPREPPPPVSDPKATAPSNTTSSKGWKLFKSFRR